MAWWWVAMDGVAWDGWVCASAAVHGTWCSACWRACSGPDSRQRCQLLNTARCTPHHSHAGRDRRLRAHPAHPRAPHVSAWAGEEVRGSCPVLACAHRSSRAACRRAARRLPAGLPARARSRVGLIRPPRHTWHKAILFLQSHLTVFVTCFDPQVHPSQLPLPHDLADAAAADAVGLVPLVHHARHRHRGVPAAGWVWCATGIEWLVG